MLISLGNEALTAQFRDRLKTAVDDTENVGCDFHFGLHEANTMLEWGINHETGFVYSKLHHSAKQYNMLNYSKALSLQRFR